MSERDIKNSPQLHAMEGGGAKQLEVASTIAKELQERTIPELQSEKSSLQRQQTALGLHRDPKDIYRQKFRYPEPLNAKRALQKAINTVGGPEFVADQKLVTRLETLESQAVRSLEYFQQETRGYKALTPHHIKKHHYLTQELSKRRLSLNDALTRYNRKVDILNQPENQKQIRLIAERFLKDDVKMQLKRLEVDRHVERVTSSLQNAYRFENGLRELGRERVEIKRATLTLGEKTVSIPLPSSESRFKEQLSRSQERTAQQKTLHARTKGLSRS